MEYDEGKSLFFGYAYQIWRVELPQKLGKLIEAAGIGDIDFQNKFAAIKIHFGEPGNLLFCAPIMLK